jgi:hypothetical protein
MSRANRHDIIVHWPDRKRKGFVNPFVSDGIVEHFDMPIWFVGQTVHDNHHCNLAHKEHVRNPPPVKAERRRITSAVLAMARLDVRHDDLRKWACRLKIR